MKKHRGCSEVAASGAVHHWYANVTARGCASVKATSSCKNNSSPPRGHFIWDRFALSPLAVTSQSRIQENPIPCKAFGAVPAEGIALTGAGLLPPGPERGNSPVRTGSTLVDLTPGNLPAPIAQIECKLFAY